MTRSEREKVLTIARRKNSRIAKARYEGRLTRSQTDALHARVTKWARMQGA